MNKFLTGWDADHEVEDTQEMIEYCGPRQWYIPYDQVADQITNEAKTHGYKNWETLYDYKMVQNKTNSCVGLGTEAAICITSERNMRLGYEQKPIRPYYIWMYAAYWQLFKGRSGTGGCSLGGMMKTINQHGFLPIADVLEKHPAAFAGSPQEREFDPLKAIQAIDGKLDWNSNRRTWDTAYAAFKDTAADFQVVTTIAPNWNAYRNCLLAKYGISYGTGVKLALKNGWYVPSGRTAHCMCHFFGNEEHAYNRNSWNDNVGKITWDTIQKQYHESGFSHFVILKIERNDRNTAEPNYKI